MQSESGGGAALSEMEAEDPTTESVETEPKAGEESPGPATEPMEEGADERSTEATETAADEAATGVEGEAEEGGVIRGDWVTIPFRYKPGDVSASPPWVSSGNE